MCQSWYEINARVVCVQVVAGHDTRRRPESPNRLHGRRRQILGQRPAAVEALKAGVAQRTLELQALRRLLIAAFRSALRRRRDKERPAHSGTV